MRGSPLPKDLLVKLYYDQKLSMQEIAERFGCSMNKVVYWMDQYGFDRRSWSEATYVYRNPAGDPFMIRLPETAEDKELFALAIGLYMGEGSKKGLHNVAMANSNPAILRIFLLFLEKFCGVSKSKVRASLNIFDDCAIEAALNWWADEVHLSREHFYETTVRQSRGGTYTNKSQYGTLSIIVSNSKLKRIIDDWCAEYSTKFFTVK